MNLLAALVVYHVDLAAHSRNEQVLAHLLFCDAVDAVDYLSFTQLEAVGVTESTALFVWDLDRHLGVGLSKDG